MVLYVPVTFSTMVRSRSLVTFTKFTILQKFCVCKVCLKQKMKVQHCDFYICNPVKNVVINTVKPVLSSHSKIDKTKVLKTNCSLMKVESIAECSPQSILQYF